MPAAYSKLALSGSNSGQQIKISATTSGSATQIHTAISSSTSFDEIWLYAYNESTASIPMSVLWGGVTEPDSVNRFTIPSQSGRTLIVDGKLLQNNLIVSCYASASNVIIIDGFVNRITQ